jgi:glycolate oxidase iron-sulfur subunit
MGLLSAGEAEPAAVARHLDACLGCLACLDACPSGVAYDAAIEQSREELESLYRRPLPERALRSAVFALFPHPRRLRVAVTGGLLARRLHLADLFRRSGLAKRLPFVAALHELLPEIGLRELWRRSPLVGRTGGPRRRRRRTEGLPAEGAARLRVGLLTGCVQQVLFASVNEATARVLSAEGCDVVAPSAQACCGALMLHTGRGERAREAARRLIEAFSDEAFDAIVVNSAGCGSAMKSYGRLLAGDLAYAERARSFSATVRDVHELLGGLETRAERHRLEVRVAYHDACHLAQAQKIRSEPRRLLQAIPGLTLLEIPDGDTCCGSAGIYNLLEPATADELGAAKAASVRTTSGALVAAGNPGCLLQLQRHLGRALPAVHPIELLDASIRGLGPEALGL